MKPAGPGDPQCPLGSLTVDAGRLPSFPIYKQSQRFEAQNVTWGRLDQTASTPSRKRTQPGPAPLTDRPPLHPEGLCQTERAETQEADRPTPGVTGPTSRREQAMEVTARVPNGAKDTERLRDVGREDNETVQTAQQRLSKSRRLRTQKPPTKRDGHEDTFEDLIEHFVAIILVTRDVSCFGLYGIATTPKTPLGLQFLALVKPCGA